mmetsp:Transcript_28858/g.44362  ORF Transcript_28858/g.44362 Transcript_28858/m.44362 type:complete len:474 (+) Transcript_28858:180-1601(+)|eukprot:CAMPEP_0195282044 /NCGR_PEP_ID=MMETSP0707-20130614/1101_1 /TAXON_ID=33640 /ORGANISM="Asterionellopsis glacialis, Strain CCMP134" /LENGTH=473 /DNA_ID=CAMNT_0040340993 /DNA_START=98 /DNA_END=1519 /DNA_ORIENTATION=-
MASIAALFSFCGAAFAFTALERRKSSRRGTSILEEVEENYYWSDEDIIQISELKEKWEYDEELERFIRCLPKVELHVHLDGSFDPTLLLNHLRETGYTCLPVNTHLPWDNSNYPVRKLVQDCRSTKDFHSLCTCRGKYSLYEMLKCFEVFSPIARGNLELLEMLAYDFCKRQAQQNVVYTEVRYSPHLLASGASLAGKHKVDADPVVTAITSGLRKGEEDYGIKVNQILSCINWRPDWANDVVRIAHERRHDTPCAIVAVDIAAGEEHFNKEEFPHLHDPHYRAMKKAKGLNLNVTMHAGEVASSSNIRFAVEEYGASRIGHGYHVVNDPSLMAEMKKHQVHFEVCPTSSVETGGWVLDTKQQDTKNWKEHPSVLMMQNGMNVGFNSDDPAVFDTSLTWQLRIALGKMGLVKDRILQSTRNSIDSAFITNDEKQTLHEVVSMFEKNEHVPELLRKHSFQDRVSGYSQKRMEEC